MYQELHGLRPLIIRPSNAYGAGQNLAKPQGVIGHFLATALKGLPVSIWGDGSIRRDFIYIDDLIDLIATAGQSEISGVFNAGAGNDASVLEIIDVLENLIGSPLQKSFLPARAYDVSKVSLDISLAEEAFNWTPKVRLADGIGRQFDALDSSIIQSTVLTTDA
jgi:UDP-glucose 4-epimerase